MWHGSANHRAYTCVDAHAHTRHVHVRVGCRVKRGLRSALANPDTNPNPNQAKRIDNMDGVMGSQHKPGQSGTHNPGGEGALEVNPDIYVPEQEVIEIENADFVQPSMTDQVRVWV